MNRIWAGTRQRLYRGARPPWLLRWHHAFLGRLAQVPDPKPRAKTVRVRWAGPEDTALLVQVRDRPITYEAMFRKGHRCVLGFQDDEPVSMNWLTGTRVHVSEANAFTFDCGRDGAWSFGDFVRLDRRRQGLFREHLRGLMELLHAEGRSKLYCAMFREDRRSVRAHVRAGYEVFMRIRTLRLVGLSVHLVQDHTEGSTFMKLGTWAGRRPAHR